MNGFTRSTMLTTWCSIHIHTSSYTHILQATCQYHSTAPQQLSYNHSQPSLLNLCHLVPFMHALFTPCCSSGPQPPNPSVHLLSSWPASRPPINHLSACSSPPVHLVGGRHKGLQHLLQTGPVKRHLRLRALRRDGVQPVVRASVCQRHHGQQPPPLRGGLLH